MLRSLYLLAKEDVASSNLVFRSKFGACNDEYALIFVNTLFLTVDTSVNNPHVSLVQVLSLEPLPVKHVWEVGSADPQLLSNLP